MVNRLLVVMTCSSHHSLHFGGRTAISKFAKRPRDRIVHTRGIALGTKGHVSVLHYSSGQINAATGSVSNTVSWQEGTLLKITDHL